MSQYIGYLSINLQAIHIAANFTAQNHYLIISDHDETTSFLSTDIRLMATFNLPNEIVVEK